MLPFLFLLAPSALAGVWVEAQPDASSLVVIARVGSEERALGCRDDGQGGDPVPGDGAWSCGEPGGEPRSLGLIVDGRTLLRTAGGAEPELTLRVDGSTLQRRAGRPEPGMPGEPRPARAALLVEVDQGPASSAPVVVVEGQQLTCQDDGRFPDRAQNDDISSCGGVVGTHAFTMRLRSGAGERSLSPVLPGGSALMQLRIDAQGVTSHPWELLASSAAPAGQPAPQPGASAGPPAQPGQAPPEQPGAQPVGSGQVSGGALAWSALLTVLTGVGAFFLGRRRRRGLPANLSWAHEPQGQVLLRPGALEQELLAASRLGPVIVLAPPEQDLPLGQPGPVLRAESSDVLDLIDALESLRREHALRVLTLLVVDEALLTAPGEVGLTALGRLETDLPPGCRAVVLTAP